MWILGVATRAFVSERRVDAVRVAGRALHVDMRAAQYEISDCGVVETRRCPLIGIVTATAALTEPSLVWVVGTMAPVASRRQRGSEVGHVTRLAGEIRVATA
jgi:hypothetical protein